MRVLNVRGVNAALPEGLRLLSLEGVWSGSRAGRCVTAPYPVMTIYEKPLERVIFWPVRDANPFFHCLEGLWMLAGRNDLAWLERFNSRMRMFSDDGLTLSGAYGYRWRKHFHCDDDPRSIDQLDMVVELLNRSPNSRRAVIQMYDCTTDLAVDESLLKDVPCNDLIMLRNNDGVLDMMTMARSHDLIWGAAGSNIVHFTMLQEYLAARLGWKVGKFFQLSWNYHAYEEVYNKNKVLIDEAADWYRKTVGDPYQFTVEDGGVRPYPLVTNSETFDAELAVFMDDEECPDLYLDVEPDNIFLRYATALRRAYLFWKFEHNIDEAVRTIVDYCPDDFDFAVSALSWLDRRKNV
jgi:thymidylate synthase